MRDAHSEMTAMGPLPFDDLFARFDDVFDFRPEGSIDGTSAFPAEPAPASAMSVARRADQGFDRAAA